MCSYGKYHSLAATRRWYVRGHWRMPVSKAKDGIQTYDTYQELQSDSPHNTGARLWYERGICILLGTGDLSGFYISRCPREIVRGMVRLVPEPPPISDMMKPIQCGDFGSRT
ncbi:hypothetical protein PISMIDRAFT_529769 [Pisolithus microcarpus 441]|uniref:Uncharacterized protein n=1 Tax=Pisolithus microcarpus 441 TaxID=765257 RepID=A0A0C9YBE3_9AGAM|nr:hypothetical protein PISMIDRAFT_529769 [Pisolithus microcarpus 441]